MKDKDKNNAPLPEDDKLHISKSVFQTSREMQEKADEELRLKREEAQRKYELKRKKPRRLTTSASSRNDSSC